jgi:hypothetical protein
MKRSLIFTVLFSLGTSLIAQNSDPSSDATLKILTVSSGQLTPDFDPHIFEYTVVNVPDSVTSITVKAEANHSAARIFFRDSIIALFSGEYHTAIHCIAGDAVESYWITVTRAQAEDEQNSDLSNDATLEILTVSSGQLTPDFEPYTRYYTVDVPDSITSITVKTEANHSAARIFFTDSVIELISGENIISIVCIAEDGTCKTVRITVTRAEAEAEVEVEAEDTSLITQNNDATLKILTVSSGQLTPDFDPHIFEYTVVNVPDSVTIIKIKAEANHSAAIIAHSDSIRVLFPGEYYTTIHCVVGNAIESYRIIVIKAKAEDEQNSDLSNDATLKILTVSSGQLTPDFDPHIFEYTVVNVPDSVTIIKIKAEANHSAANIVYRSDSIRALFPGVYYTAIHCVVGNVAESYWITIIKAKAEDEQPNGTVSGDEGKDFVFSSEAAGIAVPATGAAVSLYRESGSTVVINASGKLIEAVEIFDLSGKMQHKSVYAGVSRASWKAPQRGLYVVKITLQFGSSVIYKKTVI